MSATESIIDLIGNTPVLKLTEFDTGPCELYLKLEQRNPGGSVCDRGANAMIRTAESDGAIAAGDTLVAATTGNMGVSLALVTAHHGYSLTLVVPENIEHNKILHLKALGADVRLARADVDKDHPEYFLNVAARLGQALPGAHYLDQYSNPANALAHQRGTGPEIWEQLDHELDAFVCCAGTGATITGCARYFHSLERDVQIVLADTKGSLFGSSASNKPDGNQSASSLIQDTGSRSAPGNFDASVVDKVCTVTDAQSVTALGELLRLEAVLGGISTGVNLAAAIDYCRQQNSAQRVVTLVCDTGHGHLATAYDSAWLLEQGLLPGRQFGDLRDLITRRAEEGGVVSVAPDDTLLNAYTRIRMFDVSQLPVLDNGRIVGMIDESDLLLAVYDNREYFDYPVRDFMITRLETIRPEASISSLLPVFRGDHVAIIADESTFYGLITHVDLINHLRKSMHDISQ